VFRTTSSRLVAAVVLPSAVAVTLPGAASAQSSDVTVAPFVAFLPTTGASPLAGLAITLAGTGPIALRASGHLSLENTNGPTFTGAAIRPWGADADAVLFLGRRGFAEYRGGITPYVFAGLGVAGNDSLGLGRTTINNNWSYGVGLTVPLGSAVDVFGESRWRMSRFVLPTSQFAPTPATELRLGLSLHLGGAPSRTRNAPARGGRPSVPSTTSYPASTTVSASAARVLGTADKYVGVPYVWGGTTPSGFDCSGFTQYVFAKQGVKLPRTSRQQAQVGTAISPEWRAVAPGDLVMFAENDRISHVAIYAGHNRIIHSSSSGGGVRYDDLSTRRGTWFVDHMVAARRVTSDPRGLLLDLAKGFAELGIQLDGPDHAPRP
jgi:cell wall-associated NlpC family hydrolase